MLYNKTKFLEKDFICYKHNHTLSYLNIMKVHSNVNNTVVIKIDKRYYLGNINKNIKNVIWPIHKKVLEDVKRTYLD